MPTASHGIVRYTTTAGPALGLLVDGTIFPLDIEIGSTGGAEALLALDAETAAELKQCALRSGATLALADVELLAPIPRPQKVFAVGLNYADHIAESKMQAPDVPTIFAKFGNCIAGPHDDVVRPRVSHELDYEGELGIVIGRRCKHVPRERVHEVVGGYLVLNDFSVRDWQRLSPQWSMGKSFDTHGPIGPWVTEAGGVDADHLDIRTWVNGELRQASNTSNLVFDCADLVSYLSQACTLEPGDIIATGTPSGVGGAFSPPRYLVPGDEVRVEIEGLGALVNRVVDEDGQSADAGGPPLARAANVDGEGRS